MFSNVELKLIWISITPYLSLIKFKQRSYITQKYLSISINWLHDNNNIDKFFLCNYSIRLKCYNQNNNYYNLKF